eukprot:jgi/Hompol1/3856/HPOL_003374-RA
MTDSSFRQVRARLRICLSPLFSSNPLRGVNDYLNTYVPELNGIVLSFSNVAFTSDTASIINESPFAHFYITATFTVFSPRVGGALLGVVNKVSSDHIGMLVHGVFNASIPSSEIPTDQYIWDSRALVWRFRINDAMETVKHVKSGTVIKFAVKSLALADRMVSITGTVKQTEIETGPIDDADLEPAPTQKDLPAFDQDIDIYQDEIAATKGAIIDVNHIEEQHRDDPSNDHNDHRHKHFSDHADGDMDVDESADSVEPKPQSAKSGSKDTHAAKAKETPSKRKLDTAGTPANAAAAAATGSVAPKSILKNIKDCICIYTGTCIGIGIGIGNQEIDFCES